MSLRFLNSVFKRTFSDTTFDVTVCCCSKTDDGGGMDMALIGYARVSTGEQDALAQSDELEKFGCARVHVETASGGSRSRPQLARVLTELRMGDTLVVVRIDRLARSLQHLLEIIDVLGAKGVAFRSLRDPIDTASPQGIFTLQILGATAEFERALIRERTRAGLAAAAMQGRVGGNPGLRARSDEAIASLRIARDAAFLNGLSGSADQWLPIVRRLRPKYPWPIVANVVNSGLADSDQHWTVERLIRAVKRFVSEGFADERLLCRAPRARSDHDSVEVVATIARANPTKSLRGIARELEALRIRPPAGGVSWSAMAVKRVLARAKATRLIDGA